MTADDQTRADTIRRVLLDAETSTAPLDALLAENRRLRDALERVADWPLERTRFECSKFAREALAGDGE